MQRFLPFFLGLLLVGVLPNAVSAQNCSGGCNLVQWPDAVNPIWEFCWITPGASSGLDGSGIEIKNVKYKGQDVLKHGHTPMLNVDYDAGGCGCYRDWADSEVVFEADGVVNACYAESTSTATLCDNGGGSGDIGSFTGVALEDYGDAVEITSQMSAGWYRYHMAWVFHADGRLEPKFGFATRSATCTQAGHRHHVYWRLDFDIDGPADDYVVETSDAAADITFNTEAQRDWGPVGNTKNVQWQVKDDTNNRGYVLTPGPGDINLAIDGFSKTDFMVSKYQATELGDNSNGCAITPGDIVQSEDVFEEDVVVYYRGGHYHPAGNTTSCYNVGPMLTPIGNWNQPNFAKLKVYLKGPYLNGGTMGTDLAAGGHIPLTQPYSVAPWNYAGSETVAAMPADAVDWVLVHLRTGTDAASTVATVAALLKSDGSIEGPDGSEGADFTGLVAPGNYHVVVEHRNHLSVMTSAPVGVGPIADNYDLTVGQAQAFGTNAMIELEVGNFGLHGGDGNASGGVTANDMLTVWIPDNGSPAGYKGSDYNLSGSTTAFDLLQVWLASNGQNTQVPN